MQQFTSNPNNGVGAVEGPDQNYQPPQQQSPPNQNTSASSVVDAHHQQQHQLHSPPNEGNLAAAAISPQNSPGQQPQRQRRQNVIDPLAALANKPGIKIQLDLWKKEEEVVSQRIDRKEVRLQNTKNEIYQLLGLYFVFQGVIFTAISQATNLPNEKLWIPLVLSILASISTILALWFKLGDCAKLERLIVNEKSMAKALFQASDDLKNMAIEDAYFHPQDFKFQPRVDGIFEDERPMMKRLWEDHMKGYGAMLILILLIFSVIMAISCCLIHTDKTQKK